MTRLLNLPTRGTRCPCVPYTSCQSLYGFNGRRSGRFVHDGPDRIQSGQAAFQR